MILKGMGKKAILVVSFGTSYAKTRKVTIEACENAIKTAFPGYEIQRAFTSKRIINILKDRDNILIDTPQEALQKLRDEGFSDIIVQSLHIIPGSEFHDLVFTVKEFQTAFESLRIGMPLLASPDDYVAVADALARQFPNLAEDEAVALMGHGSSHPANAAYPALECVLADCEHPRIFIGTVEGYPELDHVIARLHKHHIRKVTLMPLMLVAGDHAQNDMAGDDDDSWKMVLEKEGFQVNIYLHGLGENTAIQQMFVQHVKDVIKNYKD